MPINNPTGRIDRDAEKRRKSASNSQGYQSARASYSDTLQASIDRREKRRAAEAQAKREAELESQKIDAQARRDKQQQLNEQSNTGQRANIAANAAAVDYGYTSSLNRQQQKGTLQRDDQQNRFTTIRDRQQALDQQQRDSRQFGYSTQENEQQFGHQMQRDDRQHGYSTQRDQLQHGNTLERDASQFGYDTRSRDQQQQNTLERDYTQHGMQRERDQVQNQFQGERDNRLNMFDTQRDQRQQQYTQQNQYQRETAEVSARWQEQIQQARNAGMDFSEKQKQEMKELDRSFRKNVLSVDYDEGLKQRAMLLHQKNLAAIVPDQKVANPKEGLESALMFDERSKSWVLQGRDSQGFPRYEPWNSGNDSMQNQQRVAQEKERQVAEKQTALTRDASFERLEKWQKVLDKHQNRVTAEGEDFYPNPTAALEAAMTEFAPQEESYRQGYGLPLLQPYQNEVDAKRKELEDQQNRPRVNPWRTSSDPQQQRQHVPVMADSARLRNGDEMPKPLPTTETTSQLDNHMKKAAQGQDKAAVVALQTIKTITEKYGDAPPEGSQELADLVYAYQLLKKKNIRIPPMQRQQTAEERAKITPPYGGDFFQF